MKYVTLAVSLAVEDNANPADVKSMLHRALADQYPNRNIDVFYGPSEHADVRNFDAKYLVPNSTVPAWLDPEAMDFRFKFMQEELDESRDAYAERNMAKFFDGLLDLAWVTHGTATMTGLPWTLGWQKIRDANMAKERATGPDDPRSKRKSALDVVKPAGWKEPDHSLLVGNGPWPTLDTSLAGIVTIRNLENGGRPHNKFDPDDHATVNAFAPAKKARKVEKTEKAG